MSLVARPVPEPVWPPGLCDQAPVPLRELFYNIMVCGMPAKRNMFLYLPSEALRSRALDERLARTAWFAHFRVSKACAEARPRVLALLPPDHWRPPLPDVMEFYLARGMWSEYARLVQPPDMSTVDESLQRIFGAVGVPGTGSVDRVLYDDCKDVMEYQARRMFSAAGYGGFPVEWLPLLSAPRDRLAPLSLLDKSHLHDIYLRGLYLGAPGDPVPLVLRAIDALKIHEPPFLLCCAVCNADDIDFYHRVLAPRFFTSSKQSMLPFLVDRLPCDIVCNNRCESDSDPLVFGRAIPAFLIKEHVPHPDALAFPESMPLWLVANDANIDLFASNMPLHPYTISKLPATPVIRAAVFAWLADKDTVVVAPYLCRWLRFWFVDDPAFEARFAPSTPDHHPRQVHRLFPGFLSAPIEVSPADFVSTYATLLLHACDGVMLPAPYRTLPLTFRIRWSVAEWRSVLDALACVRDGLAPSGIALFCNLLAAIDPACVDSSCLVAIYLRSRGVSVRRIIGLVADQGSLQPVCSLLQMSFRKYRNTMNLLRHATFEALHLVDVELRYYRARLIAVAEEASAVAAATVQLYARRVAIIDAFQAALPATYALLDIQMVGQLLSTWNCSKHWYNDSYLLAVTAAMHVFGELAHTAVDLQYIAAPQHSCIGMFIRRGPHVASSTSHCDLSLLVKETEQYKKRLDIVANLTQREVIDTFVFAERYVAMHVADRARNAAFSATIKM